jgi:hypothetical protein
MSELIEGPYKPPKCRMGSVLHDEMLGDVRVVGRSKAPIAWPLCEEPPRPGPNPFGTIPILCGDLVKAVCEESTNAVAEWWGVSPRLVRRWRQAISGEDTNISTALTLKRYDPEFRRKFY